MKTPIITFEDFSFQYHAQAKPTLKNINLTIYEGEKVLIVGPSGSGKSTMGNCLNGLVPFNYKGTITGSLKIKGKETRDMSVFELSSYVGTVLQDPDSQFIGLTVAEDIAFQLENECVPQEEMKKKVDRAAQLVGSEDYLEAAPQRLSGGQKQRVTLAGVIVSPVDILLFDEPLASLDPATGQTAISLIEKIKAETQKTVVIVEHRIEDVLHEAVDRIIVMSEGTIVADLTPAELLVSPILEEVGLRKPLYIQAMQYAGCEVSKIKGIEHMSTALLENNKAILQAWQESYNAQDKAVCTNAPLLAFEHVSFGYEKGKQQLKDISFTIHKGEMLSIVGKNGAGKSTLSKLICGFYAPTKGRILLDGQDMKGLSIKERSSRIGVVLQNPNQMISKTMIFDEVALGLRVRGEKEEVVKERVYETLKICGLYPFRNWPISALSYGQKKRVTIASILVLKPELLILDEPTAGQDYKHYTEMMQFLEQLNKDGMTILMVTHDMHLMLEYTNRAIVLSEGELLADGKQYDVLTDEQVVEKAHLKETSLYTLALKAGLKDPKAFVKHFIEVEREKRCQIPH